MKTLWDGLIHSTFVSAGWTGLPPIFIDFLLSFSVSEYVDEAMLIPKNTSVLIRRVPGRPRKTIVAAPDEYCLVLQILFVFFLLALLPNWASKTAFVISSLIYGAVFEYALSV